MLPQSFADLDAQARGSQKSPTPVPVQGAPLPRTFAEIAGNADETGALRADAEASDAQMLEQANRLRLEQDAAKEQELIARVGDGPLAGVVAGLRGAGRGFQNLAARGLDAVGVLPDGAGDEFVRVNDARQAGAQRDLGQFSKDVSGATRSLAQMAASGMGWGAILGAGVMEGNEAITEARDAGLSGLGVAGYATAQGAWEMLPAAIMQKIPGMAGLEGAFAPGMRKLFADGVAKGLMRATGKAITDTTLKELPEELVTEIGHAVISRIGGVNPDALNPDNLQQIIRDTTVQTLLMGGGAAAVRTGADAVQHGGDLMAMRRALAEIDQAPMEPAAAPIGRTPNDPVPVDRLMQQPQLDPIVQTGMAPVEQADAQIDTPAAPVDPAAYDPAQDAAVAPDRQDFDAFLKEAGQTPEQFRQAVEQTADLTEQPADEQGVRVGKSAIEGKGIMVQGGATKGQPLATAFDAQGKRTPAGRYMNHSAKPNSMLVREADGRIVVVPQRDMQAGEEVTVDYRQARQAMQPPAQPKPAKAPKAQTPAPTQAKGDWAAFDPQETLGVPRTAMPQVATADRPALMDWMKSQGVRSNTETVAPASLKPTQAEFSPAKVKAAAAQMAADRAAGKPVRPILVSKDGYVIDGHHQWLAAKDAGEQIPVIRIEAPAAQALQTIKRFPKAGQGSGATPAPKKEANAGRSSAPAPGAQQTAAPGAVEPVAPKPAPATGGAPADQAPDRPASSSDPASAPNAVAGDATTIDVPGGQDMPATYEVRELDSLIASGDYSTGAVRKNDAYPADLQPRDYAAGSAEDLKVQSFAQGQKAGYYINTDPSAANGPPTVTANGTVLNGNGRTMSLQLAASRGDMGWYRRELDRLASVFGLDPQGYAAMRQPVLVRVAKVEPTSEAAKRFARQGNVSSTQAQSPARTAASLGNLVDQGVLDTLDLEDEATTFSEAVGGSAGRDFRQALASALPAQEVPRYLNEQTGGLTEAGKELVRDLLLTKQLPVELIERLREDRKAMLRSLEQAIPQMMRLDGVAPEADVAKHLTDALEWISRHPEVTLPTQLVDSVDGSGKATQQDLTGRQDGMSPEARMMAEWLLGNAQKGKSSKPGLVSLIRGLENRSSPILGDTRSGGQIAADALGVPAAPGASFGVTATEPATTGARMSFRKDDDSGVEVAGLAASLRAAMPGAPDAMFLPDGPFGIQIVAKGGKQVVKVRVALPQDFERINAQERANAKAAGREPEILSAENVNGWADGQTIYMVPGGATKHTYNHELVHALVNMGVLTRAEVEKLAKLADKVLKPNEVSAIKAAYRGSSAGMMTEEMAAHVIEAMAAKKARPSAVDRVLAWLRDMAAMLRLTTQSDYGLAKDVASGRILDKRDVGAAVEADGQMSRRLPRGDAPGQQSIFDMEPAPAEPAPAPAKPVAPTGTESVQTPSEKALESLAKTVEKLAATVDKALSASPPAQDAQNTTGGPTDATRSDPGDGRTAGRPGSERPGDAGAGGRGTQRGRGRVGGDAVGIDGADRAESGGTEAGRQGAVPEGSGSEAVADPGVPRAGPFRFRSVEGAMPPRGAIMRARTNLDALRAIRAIQAEGRQATAAEREAMARFSGWGSLKWIFDPKTATSADASKKALYQDALALLPEGSQERERAVVSTLNAHYTHPQIVADVWSMVKRGMGSFAGAPMRALEPSAGLGVFLGLEPDGVRGSLAWAAVEKEPGTAAMFGAVYPEAATAAMGFEEWSAPDNAFDLVISNVPFGSIQMFDKRYAADLGKPNIHDYFFVKAMDKVRPGGLVAFITSTGTMDKPTDEIRRHLYAQGDLVHAVRFPADAHDTAGTSVVTDLLILRKRLPGEPRGDRSWLTTGTVKDPLGGDPIPLNNWFKKHPELVLGRIERSGNLWGVREDGQKNPNVVKQPDYQAKLDAAMQSMPANVMTAPVQRAAFDMVPAPADLKNHAIVGRDGAIWQNQGGTLIKIKVGKENAERVGWMRTLVANLRAVWAAEQAGGTAAAERAILNKTYDGGRKLYGALSDQKNASVFATDPDAPNLMALEEMKGDPDDESSLTFEKTAIFRQQVVRPPPVLGQAKNAAEAVTASMGRSGRVDPQLVADALGITPEAAIERMSAEGAAFEEPGGGWAPAWSYLQGNVKAKLAEARDAAAKDQRFTANVAALEQVQPEPVGANMVSPTLGAPFAPLEVMNAFARSEIGGSVEVFKAGDGRWLVQGYADAQGQAKWQVKGRYKTAGPTTALDVALNRSKPDMDGKDQDDKRLPDPEATQAVLDKAAEIRTRFADWIRLPEQADHLAATVQVYNDTVNVYRHSDPDTSWITFAGMIDKYKNDTVRRRSVARALTEGRLMLAHEVGLGKSASMFAVAMEGRRLGIARKPMIATINAVVPQLAREAMEAYPGKNILVQPTAWGDPGSPTGRDTFISRLATQDYDVAIVSHETLTSIDNDPELMRERHLERIAEIKAAKAAAEANAKGSDTGRRYVSSLAKMLENEQQKMAEMSSHVLKKDHVSFADIGTDLLIVDECFPWDTPVITDIGTLPIGDIVENKRAVKVLSQNNDTGALEWKSVVRWIPIARHNKVLKVVHEYGFFTCTEDHKIWTQRGYVEAKALLQTDDVFFMRNGVHADWCSGENLRAMHGGDKNLCALSWGLHLQVSGTNGQREEGVLFNQMQDAGAAVESDHGSIVAIKDAGNVAEPTDTRAQVAGIGRTHAEEQSDAKSGNRSQDARGNGWPTVQEQGRERKDDAGADGAGECAGVGCGTRDTHQAGVGDVPRTATLLQGGPGEPPAQVGRGGGRKGPQTPVYQEDGRAQDGRLERSRVARVEVLESAGAGGSSDCRGQHQTVYDIEVEGNHNFFAAGVLVSNCHAFKNLPFITVQEGVLGLGGKNSKRAEDLLMKIRALHKLHGAERGVVLATGTPISNTMSEVYAFQHFLQPKALKAHGVNHFDDWCRAFGEPKQVQEVQADGTRKMVTRFAQWVNIHGLSRMLRDAFDVGLARDNERVRKGLPDSTEKVVRVPLTKRQRQYREWIAERMAEIKERKGPPKKGDDNILVVLNDARRVSIDLRLVAPGATEADGSKIPATADGVAELYLRGPKIDGKAPLQFIFQDVQSGTGKNEQERTPWGFNLNAALIDALVARGVPRNRIAVVDGSLSKREIAQVKRMASTGRYAVLIGRTDTLGTGTNAQQYAIATWHLDVPPRPADIIQRDGRAVRSGNLHKDKGNVVTLHRVVTEGTMDEALWGRVGLKHNFITGVMGAVATPSGATDMREVETDNMDPEMIAAMASGDHDLVRIIDLEAELGTLLRAKKAHASQGEYLRSSARQLRQQADAYDNSSAVLRGWAETSDGKAPEKATLDDGTDSKKLDAALAQYVTEAIRSRARPVRLGTFAGLPVMATDISERTEMSKDGQEMTIRTAVVEYAGNRTTATSGSALLGRIRMRVKELPQLAKADAESSARLRNEAQKAEQSAGQLGPWPKQEVLTALEQEHATVKARIAAKPKIPTTLDADARAMFNSGMGMRQARKAAEEARKEARKEDRAAAAPKMSRRIVAMTEEATKPEREIVNPIDPSLSPEAKAADLTRLTNENRKVVVGIIAKARAMGLMMAKDNVKDPANVVLKAKRPEILAKKPWHQVEHIRDSYRFKVPIRNLDQLPEIFKMLFDAGITPVKYDSDKLFNPKEWGWRFVGMDLRMPNGQIVESYMPFEQMDDKRVKGPNHHLFEKWRNLPRDEVSKRKAEREADVAESRARYDEAFRQALAEAGIADDTQARTAFARVEDRIASLMSEYSSRNTAALGSGGLATQVAPPSSDMNVRADGVPESRSTTSESSDSQTSSMARPSAADDSGPEQDATSDVRTPKLSRRLEVDGKQRPAENANGKPIAQTDDAIRNFWRWFGDSKVVDEQGRPLVVYHGSSAKFDIFKAGKEGSQGPGMYFAADPNTAQEWGDFYSPLSTSAAVMPVYLRISDPYIATADTENWTKAPDDIGEHDGVMRRFPDGQVEIVAFKPEQIKSATGNRGTFDPVNPSILMSKRIGRPDLANPGTTGPVRQMVDEVDEARNQAGEPQRKPDQEREDEAEKRFAADPDGERRKLMDKYRKGEFTDDVETRIAHHLINRDALRAITTRSGDEMLAATKIMAMYRANGSDMARAFRARMDRMASPEERVNLLTQAILTPPAEVLAQVRQKYETGQAQEAEAIMRKHAEEAKKVLDVLKAQGIDPADLTLPDKLTDPVKMAQVLRTISTIRGSRWGDALLEYWVNAILSGPYTHVVNTVGNAASTGWDLTVQRWAEVAVGMATNADGKARAGELLPMYTALFKALPKAAKNFVRSFQAENDVFQWEVQGVPVAGQQSGTKVEDRAAIKGVKGRIIRTATRLLTASDSFAKTVIGHTQATAEAYRSGVDRGLSGAQLAAHMDSEIADYGSKSWHNALGLAQELTFQSNDSGILKGIQRLRNYETVGNLKPFAFVLPFTRTPWNIFATGIRKTPLGSAALAYRLGREGYRRAFDKDNAEGAYAGRDAVRHAAEQTLAWAVMLVLAGMVYDRDEKDRPLITGTGEGYGGNRGKRENEGRVTPPLSIRIGDTWYSYARIEPAATAMGMMVDMIEAQRDGTTADAAVAKTASALMEQVRNKTFLSGVSDLMNALEDPERFGSRYTANFAASWMPNLIRQPLRATQEVFPEGKPLPQEAGESPVGIWLRAVGRSMLPIEAMGPPPKIDVWGREIPRTAQLNTDWWMRMGESLTWPLPRRLDRGTELDLVVRSYNTANPEEQWWPTTPAAYYKVNGKRIDMTEAQYEAFLRERGAFAMQQLAGLRWDKNTPAQAWQIEQVQRALRRATTLAKAKVLRDINEQAKR